MSSFNPAAGAAGAAAGPAGARSSIFAMKVLGFGIFDVRRPELSALVEAGATAQSSPLPGVLRGPRRRSRLSM